MYYSESLTLSDTLTLTNFTIFRSLTGQTLPISPDDSGQKNESLGGEKQSGEIETSDERSQQL